MPLTKILFKPGVNRENTRYTTEGGWYECDKIRFRQGTPEVIGGWERISGNTFLGVCRSMWNWTTLSNFNLLGLGTNLKFYIENGGAYNDITPIRVTTTLGSNPFLGNGTTTVTVTAPSHGAVNGDYVTFSGVTGTYASLLNTQFSITFVDVNSYTITTSSAVAAGTTGGSAVSAAYQVSIGTAIQQPYDGWGAGTWGAGTWGIGGTTTTSLRIWSQNNFGQDLVFGPRGGAIYYWQADNGITTRGVALNTLGGTVTFTSASPTVVTLTSALTEGTAVQFAASGSLPTGISAATTYYLFNVNGLTANLLDTNGAQVNTSSTGSGVYISKLVDVPTLQNYLFVSDVNRFVFAFGANDYGSAIQNPMLARWSNQNNVLEWTPDATNQAGSVQLSHGSQIITAVQTRQEIVVFTDSSVYSFQYLGPPVVWGTQLLGDNISIISQNSAVVGSGVIYWMGVDKFYMYDGRVQTLSCDLRKFIYNDINLAQGQQVFAGTNEGFNEVWWFYCSITGPNGTGTAANPNTTIDRYVVYNYLEQVWYYGTMARTAWNDSGLRATPQAATYSYNIVDQESGLNDKETATTLPINAYISSSEFDIGDGHNFGYIWRVLPDLTFNNSSTDPNTGALAQLTMTLYPMANSGSGVGTSASAAVTKSATYNITEEFTGIVYTRVRGRQLIFKAESNQINTSWQLGAPRIDIRPDGRR
jgi:hypothetical protein